MKEFEIYGCIETPADVDMDRLSEEFIRWIESKGWYFGGGFREMTEYKAEHEHSAET